MNAIFDFLTFSLLAWALALTALRLILGPSLPDRAVALDLLGTVVLAFIAANSLQSGETLLLDVLLVSAIILFLGTIALAHYLERIR
ncbi:MAG: monovalent cation/H+ antiporter complex subunit F [Chthoniobacterales bacterium]|nr:monovalent cation/H+ antiporter complex subunit F [Chthoniobacterales bacterium]MCX7712170.1 monovalent cation/H+ antiporter complex subunit F [Chthoniobacterales bacterium]